MNKSTAPEGFHSVTPYLLVEDAAAVIDFMQRAFHAQVVHKQELPDGTVVHAQVRIGDSMVMLGQAGGEMGPMPAMLYLYDANVDAAYARALGAGAESLRKPVDEDYGDRVAGVKDIQGNQWWIATSEAGARDR